MSKELTVSIAMCTCNGEAYLAEQLQSIAAQSRLPDELVICDDASTDNTSDIATRFTHSAPFPVRWSVNPQRLGPAQNFAEAIKRCVSDIIVLADQDDLWRPDKLNRLYEKFASDDSVGLVFSDMRLIDGSSQPVGRTQWQALGFGPRQRRMFLQGKGFNCLLRHNVVNGAAMAFRAPLREAVLPISDGWVHDEWIALIISAVSSVALIDDTLQDYRIHTDQQVGPAVRGIRNQLAYAKKHMDEAYFIGMLDRSRAARDRIKSLGDQVIRADAPGLLDQRIDHFQNRVNMRSPRTFRLPMILRELLSGRYHRFGYSWKGAAQDLLLR
jgi:glycosyltransferase involved in cell wall biosynthesis